MKRSIIALAAVLIVFLSGASEAAAQSRFGVMGGFTFSKLEKHSMNRSNMTQYHAGLTYQLKLPLGFSIQPSLLYQVKGAKLSGKKGEESQGNALDLSIGYLELPVSFQWGPDLLLFRPFLDITPFIGYGLNNNMNFSGQISDFTQNLKNSWKSTYLNRLEYGLGLGIGLEIWKFQLIARYNWNFGHLSNFKYVTGQDAMNEIKNKFSRSNFGGFTLTAAFLF